MDGGPSQVDTFDPKPRLDREHGQPIKVKTHPTQFNNVGNVLKCPWKFRQYGESGIPVSDLFPNVARRVDDLAIIRSMVSNFSEHTAANYFLHTGSGLQGRPSHGAWVDLRPGERVPGPARLRGPQRRPDPPRRHGLLQQRLPARRLSGLALPPADEAARQHPRRRSRADAAAPQARPARDSSTRGVVDRMGQHDDLEAAIGNYELAYKMQAAVPELTSLEGESPATTAALRARRRVRADADLRRASACSPADWSSAACGSSRSSARPSATTAGTSTAT